MTGRRKKKFESIKTVLLYVALIFMAFIMLIRIRQITRLPKKVSPPDRGGES